jgi:hypothetical protein
MDPFTAIGLASNILSFIDFSAQLINGAREIYDSTAGTTEDNKSREAIVSEMKIFSSKLLPPDDSQLSGDEKALCRLAAECNILSSQILDLLGKIKPKDPKSKSQSFWAALKNKVHEKEKLELEKRLENCRSQLELQLNYWMRSPCPPYLTSPLKPDHAAVLRQRPAWMRWLPPHKKTVLNSDNYSVMSNNSAEE